MSKKGGIAKFFFYALAFLVIGIALVISQGQLGLPRACGDGSCDSTENPTNCPQDCKLTTSSAPVLSFVSPSSVTANQAVTFTITGSNFQQGAVAKYYPSSGGTTETVALTFDSSTQLRAVFPSGINAGTWVFYIQNPDGKVSEKLSVVATKSAVCGDNICDSTENPINCPQDCKKKCSDYTPEECLKYDNCVLTRPLKYLFLRQVCVDKCLVPQCAAPPEGCYYEGGTDANGCPTCGTLVCGACGNGVCDSTENPTNCPQDCMNESLVPAPLLSSVSPTSVTAGQAVTFTLTGANFQRGAIAKYYPASTDQVVKVVLEFDSTTQLHVVFPSGIAAGTWFFYIENPDGKISDKLSVLSIAPQTSSCGNNICESTENPTNCPQDCGTEKKPICKIGGCSGEICGESSLIDKVSSACVYKPEYTCYKEFGKCGVQADDICGWTPTEELVNCLKDSRAVCGNGICDSTENPSNCPQDCKKKCPDYMPEECLKYDNCRLTRPLKYLFLRQVCIDKCITPQCPATPEACKYENGTDENGCPTCGKLVCPQMCKTDADCQQIACPIGKSQCPQNTCADGKCVMSTCGDGVCASTENPTNCPQDCSLGSIKANVFIIEDDGTLASNSRDPSVLTRKFYEKYPDKDVYDFIGFHFKNGAEGGITYSYQAQYTAQGTFSGTRPNQSEQHGSKGRLLGGYVDSFDFNKVYVKKDQNNDPISLLDNFYFSLLFHELTHYWGVILPEQLKEALVFDGTNYNQGHWEFFTGSWVSVRPTTRLKVTESPEGKYYFNIDCSSEPKQHDFDLYSMGLKSPSEIKEKLVVTAEAGQIPGFIQCDKSIEVSSDFIRKVFTIQEMVKVLGPRIPSVENSQKDFTIAFVMIVPKGSALSQEEINALNWIANKFPVAWYKSTEGRLTLNNFKLQDSTPPVISNVRTSATKSSITVSWTTNEPAASFVLYTHQTGSTIPYPNVITTPPKLSIVHTIAIDSGDFTPILPDVEYSIEIISIDENYNLASFDVGKVKTQDLICLIPVCAAPPEFCKYEGGTDANGCPTCGTLVCGACGNGVCDSTENPTNCPADCKKESIINVISAVYAANCGTPTKVSKIADACNGKAECDYTFNYVTDVGYDPAYGCAKDFKVEYSCSGDGKTNSFYIGGEAGLNSKVILNCGATRCGDGQCGNGEDSISCPSDCKKIDCTQLTLEECSSYPNCELTVERKQKVKCTEKPPVPSQSMWTRFQGDRAATGRSSLGGPRSPNLKWKLMIGGWASPPVIGSDDTIYFAESFGYVHAYSLDGKEKWSLTISTPSWPRGYSEEKKRELASEGFFFGIRYVSPLIGNDGTIYFATQFPQYPGTGAQEEEWFSDNKNQLGLYAVDPSGKLKWKYVTGEDISSAPNIGNNGDIYFRTIKDFYAVKPDGTLRWKYPLNGGAKVSNPAVSEDGTIYVVDEELRALDPDGKLKWSYKDNSKKEIASFAAHPTIGKSGNIYFGTENYFYAVKPSGALLWKKNIGWTESSPAIGPNGEIYIGTGAQEGKAYFYALDPDSGMEIWKYAVEGPIDASPVVDTEGVIYVASDDGYYYSLSSSGKLLWKFDMGRNTVPELGLATAEADGAPAIGPGGTLYFGHSGGQLHQIPEKHFSFFAIGAS